MDKYLLVKYVVLLISSFPPCFFGQMCYRTPPNYSTRCPAFSQEAYLIETRSPSGRSLYQAECCDSKGFEWSRAGVRGCIATQCVPFSSQPCSSLPRYIINKQAIPYEDVRRDQCQDSSSGQRGQIAVCCPPNSQANFLLSGYGAELNEFPHMARLETQDEVCGGTVYNYNTVITAAHCVVDKQGNVKDPRGFKLILGTNIATSDGPSGANVYPVATTIVHPGYSLLKSHPEFSKYFTNRRTFNDIALLRLGRNIDFSRNIRALPIAPKYFSPGQYGSHVTTVGWGTSDNGITSDYLLKANLLVRGDEQCFRGALGGLPYPNTYELAPQLHCFGGILNGQESPVAGKGDSGGPAICRGPDGYAVHCGVTSFGGNGDLCRRNVDQASCPPSVYADVSYFHDWIVSNAGGQDGRTLWRKILFGNYQPWNRYPHQVRITSDGGPSCGGTLISRDTVVTAGHCVFTQNQSWRNGLRVLAWGGGWYRHRDGGLLTPNDFASYNALLGLKGSHYQGATWIDNLAIIKLNGVVPINSAMLPSLPNRGSGPLTNDYVMELAWPMNKENGKDFLVERYFKVIQQRECQMRLDRLRILGAFTRFGEIDKFICGVEDYSGGGVCERLLGGGVICPGGNNPGAGVLCGVQTFRFCQYSMPTVFLNVASYSDLLWRGVAG